MNNIFKYINVLDSKEIDYIRDKNNRIAYYPINNCLQYCYIFNNKMFLFYNMNLLYNIDYNIKENIQMLYIVKIIMINFSKRRNKDYEYYG